MKEISGENQYQNYLKNLKSKKGIYSEKEFYLIQLNKKWNKINRCC